MITRGFDGIADGVRACGLVAVVRIDGEDPLSRRPAPPPRTGRATDPVDVPAACSSGPLCVTCRKPVTLSLPRANLSSQLNPRIPKRPTRLPEPSRSWGRIRVSVGAGSPLSTAGKRTVAAPGKNGETIAPGFAFARILLYTVYNAGMRSCCPEAFRGTREFHFKAIRTGGVMTDRASTHVTASGRQGALPSRAAEAAPMLHRVTGLRPKGVMFAPENARANALIKGRVR